MMALRMAHEPKLATSRRFGKYKDETEQGTRKLEHAQGALTHLVDAYKSFKCPYPRDKLEILDEPYSEASALLKRVDYSKEDVKAFSIALAEYQGAEDFPKKAGLFLSALINTGKDPDYFIPTKHLSVLINDFGHTNMKNVVVEGDLGDVIGHNMGSGTMRVLGNCGDHVGHCTKGGRIIVEGDVGFAAGYLKEGDLIIHGNAGHALGSMMEGGFVLVVGNAKENVGDYMYGGEIRIEGNYDGLGDSIRHGKIYHRGKLIVDK